MNTSRRQFVKNMMLVSASMSLIPACERSLTKTPISLARSAPEGQGVDSRALLNLIEAMESKNLNLHSLMILRRGNVIAEGWWKPYAPKWRHSLYSLSKSFTSTAIGLAQNEGLLNINDRVTSFFPDDLPPNPSANLMEMRIRHLLTMSTGQHEDTTSSLLGGEDKNWIKTFLAQEVESVPGQPFVYNSGATFMLSAILQKKTGQTLLEFLTPRLFEPLGITGADWEISPNKIDTGGWGLRIRTEDIARFGQTLLNRGKWDDTPIIPESWMQEATKKQVNNSSPNPDWAQGYGYQFWRCRHNAFRGDGAFGQFCVIMPDQEMVVVTTAETPDMQGILDEIWKIIPNLKNQPVPVNDEAATALANKLESLALPLPKGLNTSPFVNKLHGKTIRFNKNDSGIDTLSLAFENHSCQITIKDALGEHSIKCGLGSWNEGSTNLSYMPLKLVPTPVPNETSTVYAAAAAWTTPESLSIQLRFLETAHYEMLTFHFSGNNAELSLRRSMAVITDGQDLRPVLKGKVMA